MFAKAPSLRQLGSLELHGAQVDGAGLAALSSELAEAIRRATRLDPLFLPSCGARDQLHSDWKSLLARTPSEDSQ